jgi:hypothetical protein
VDALARLVRAPVNDAWVSDAVSLVEDAIGLLVDTFVSAPYLHRVEHSFHAELISEPRKHQKFRVSVEIGASGFTTQLIHKEWPETVVRVPGVVLGQGGRVCLARDVRGQPVPASWDGRYCPCVPGAARRGGAA